jgi:hypothetical protein
MLILNKWALTDTMLSLSHPERAPRATAVVESRHIMGKSAEPYDADDEFIFSRHYSEFSSVGDFEF